MRGWVTLNIPLKDFSWSLKSASHLVVIAVFSCFTGKQYVILSNIYPSPCSTKTDHLNFVPLLFLDSSVCNLAAIIPFITAVKKTHLQL